MTNPLRWLLSTAVLLAFTGPAGAGDDAGREALTVLKSLRAMTGTQPTHAEYLGRVAYAKSRINILLTKVSDKALSSAISASVGLYYLAGDIWTETLQGRGSHVSSRDRADD